MEEKVTEVSGFAVTNDEALGSFQLAPTTETLKATDEPKVMASAGAATPPASATAAAAPPANAADATPPASTAAAIPPAVSSTETKKKRGRPRKYGPDGKRPLTLALSPMPISSSIPLAGEFPNWKRENDLSLAVIKKPQRFEYENPGKFLLKVSYTSFRLPL